MRGETNELDNCYSLKLCLGVKYTHSDIFKGSKGVSSYYICCLYV